MVTSAFLFLVKHYLECLHIVNSVPGIRIYICSIKFITMKTILPFLVMLLFFTSCYEEEMALVEERGDTHFVKGTIRNGLTDEAINDLTVNARTRDNDLGAYTLCDRVYENGTTSYMGKFNLEFESHCDAKISIRKDNDHPLDFGYCYAWYLEDKNGIMPDKNFSEFFLTERGRDYDLEIRYQPQLHVYFAFNDVPELEFDSIAINRFAIQQDTLPERHFHWDITEESKLSGSVQVKLFFKDGSRQDLDFPYDYYEDCSPTFKIDL